MNSFRSLWREEDATIPYDRIGENDADSEISSVNTRSTDNSPRGLGEHRHETAIVRPFNRLRQQVQRRQRLQALSPQADINEEELIHQRAQRRRRLVIRPFVVLVLGLFVFRNNGNNNNGSVFHTAMNSESNGNSNNNDLRFSRTEAVGMAASADTTKLHNEENSNESNAAGKSLFSDIFRGNPSASIYNFVTDINDDDANDDFPMVPDNDLVQGARTLPKLRNPTGSIQTKNGDGTSQDWYDNRDPLSYGWVPEMYPDPRTDPVRCGIAYLLQQHPKSLEVTEAAAEEERRGGLVVSETKTAANSTTTRPSLSDTRLCDPDWVLGGAYLEKIAQKMKEVSERFTTSDLVPMLADDQPEDSPQYRQGLSLAVATVRKMNINAVLKEKHLFYSYGDDDDMVNDAAQIFARTLHNQWWEQRNAMDNNNNKNTVNGDAQRESTPSSEKEQRRSQQEEYLQTGGWRSSSNNKNHNRQDFGVLLFMSIQDRVCFISTGSAISTVLPWWRLEHIVSSMKPDLRHRDYGQAVIKAIDYLSEILEEGPPTFEDRVHDFLARFGMVIFFAFFTFIFGAYGECRDRRKRWQYAENRSLLNSVEREKARLKQKEFQTQHCPICLEPFINNEEDDDNDNEQHSRCCQDDVCCNDVGKHSLPLTPGVNFASGIDKGMIRVDSYGIPLNGADSKKIKILRCGHIFCHSCWIAWVHSGYGNPCICPVCRQDVGKSSGKSRRRKEQRRAARRAREAAAAAENAENATGEFETTQQALITPSLGTGGGLGSSAHPTYGSLDNADTRITSLDDIESNQARNNNAEGGTSGFFPFGASVWV